MLIIDSDLEKAAATWVTQISADVNSKMSAGLQAANLPDGRMIVTNVGSVS